MSYLFYCTHIQLCVPQYKVNVWSTWYLQLCLEDFNNKLLRKTIPFNILPWLLHHWLMPEPGLGLLYLRPFSWLTYSTQPPPILCSNAWPLKKMSKNVIKSCKKTLAKKNLIVSYVTNKRLFVKIRYTCTLYLPTYFDILQYFFFSCWNKKIQNTKTKLVMTENMRFFKKWI